jgi:hypothetical protein
MGKHPAVQFLRARDLKGRWGQECCWPDSRRRGSHRDVLRSDREGQLRRRRLLAEALHGWLPVWGQLRLRRPLGDRAGRHTGRIWVTSLIWSRITVQKVAGKNGHRTTVFARVGLLDMRAQAEVRSALRPTHRSNVGQRVRCPLTWQANADPARTAAEPWSPHPGPRLARGDGSTGSAAVVLANYGCVAQAGTKEGVKRCQGVLANPLPRGKWGGGYTTKSSPGMVWHDADRLTMQVCCKWTGDWPSGQRLAGGQAVLGPEGYFLLATGWGA